MTFSTWSQTAASNTSVGGISTDGTVTLVKQIDNMFRGMMAELAVARDDGTIAATEARGYLHGLTLSNNAGDATNDIDIAVGECVTDASPYWKMALASALTKQLDVAWAVGTNQGMRATGVAIANTTYHIFLIRRPDTGVVDIAADTSATGANIAANTNVAYTQKRRIGSILREAGAIVVFFQNGDHFKRVNFADRSSTSAQANTLLTLSVPLGISVAPLLQLTCQANASSNGQVTLGSGSEAAPSVLVLNVNANASEASLDVALPSPMFFTNTSAQIRFSAAIIGTLNVNSLTTLGWVDMRGRLS